MDEQEQEMANQYLHEQEAEEARQQTVVCNRRRRQHEATS